MFDEDCCLQCGRPMQRSDNRIYCSDACQALDDSSPSLSTASSAFPSPALLPAAPPVPHDLPSLTLGMAVSSPKAAYPPTYPIWYDDDDEADLLAVRPNDDGPLRTLDALSYARRPSSTNTRSTIPLLHRHSSSSTTHSSASLSVPSTEDDSDASAPPPLAVPSQHHRRRSHGIGLGAEITDASSTVSARKRNRASLPAYFSLLTLGAPHVKATLPLSPPHASHTRPSPTTPRLARPTVDSTHAIAGASPSSVPLYAEEYRGRRREPAAASRARARSPSRSRSRSREWLAGKDEPRGRRRLDELDGWAADREYGYGRGRSGLRDRDRVVRR
ncbi:hypothetical protein BC834DRAFT_474537 [Gloeopeniophorella convolvens]|nr:hypothetical protein BC834DRAFT_474537 [Gloeopeniophorella convolvens]